MTGYEVSAEQIPAHAEARWKTDETSIVIYGQRYFSIPAFMQQWVSAHECGHPIFYTSDDFAANCHALPILRPDKDLFPQSRCFAQKDGLLPAKYRGSGPYFRETLTRPVTIKADKSVNGNHP